jgi:replication factor C small subunit
MFASTMAVTDEMIKVLILDEADALTNSMQQALRRTMEIYNDVCRFIFITPSLAGWSPAIISRCVPFNFPYPPQDQVRLLVENIAAKEGVSIEPTALDAIARESAGDMRRATNLLQIAAAYGKTITEDHVYQCTETTLTEGVRNMISMAIDGSFKKSRRELRRLLALERFSAKEVLLEIERDIVKRPFQPLIMSQVLDRLGEIDYRVVQASNPFIQITAFLASIQRIASESAS